MPDLAAVLSIPELVRPLLRRRRTWLLYAGFWGFLAIVWSVGYTYNIAAAGESLSRALIFGPLTGIIDAVSWAAACAAGFWAAWRYPVERERMAATLLRMVGLIVAIVVVRIALISIYVTLANGAQYSYVGAFVSYFGLMPGHVTGMAVFVAAGHGIVAVLRERQRRLAVSRLEARLAEERFRALKAQLRPRFLFDSLREVRSLMSRDREAAERLLAQLAEMLRMSFRRADVHEVGLAQELSFVMLLAEMEHTRGAAPVHVRSTVPPALRSAPVPHLGVFPLVESAVLCGGRGPLEVEVRAGVEDGRLRVDVRDDGPTPLAGRRAHPGWEPVALLEERLRELPEGGFRLDFADLPGRGVRASLAVPFRQERP